MLFEVAEAVKGRAETCDVTRMKEDETGRSFHLHQSSQECQ